VDHFQAITGANRDLCPARAVCNFPIDFDRHAIGRQVKPFQQSLELQVLRHFSRFTIQLNLDHLASWELKRNRLPVNLIVTAAFWVLPTSGGEEKELDTLISALGY
jgi:hypothetical protein